ncbi:hypothetical protein L2E82_16049 [Cichorium intybus]|uniref:Uncharacterized protein n=1 Tax=Cichorium intybus TaxID=13427 RepID=A0ACB9F5N8_CICIN|nr:hypothetical protein L2E82_16049 [Cichorium intybus]
MVSEKPLLAPATKFLIAAPLISTLLGDSEPSKPSLNSVAFKDGNCCWNFLLGFEMCSSQIPNTISYIYRLSDLDLSLNRISGPIPESLGKMAVSATLNLDGNMISDRLPATLISSDISILNLSKNAIEGSISKHFQT